MKTDSTGVRICVNACLRGHGNGAGVAAPSGQFQQRRDNRVTNVWETSLSAGKRKTIRTGSTANFGKVETSCVKA